MKTLALILIVLFSPTGSAIEDLLAPVPEFIANDIDRGLTYLVIWQKPEAAANLVRAYWSNPANLNIAARQDWRNLDTQARWAAAVNDAFVDTTADQVRPVLMFDLRETENLRVLDYKKNRNHKHLRRLAREHGTSYADREAAYRVLADQFEVDVIRNDPGQSILLKPERVRLLSFAETVLELTRLKNYPLIEMLSRIECDQALMLEHNAYVP